MSVSSLWRAWCRGHGMGEAGQGAFAGFMVSNRSPSSPIRFSLLSTKMSAVDWFFFSSQIKNRVVFLGSAGIADCNSFSAKHYGLTDIVWGAGWQSKLCFSNRVNQGHEENQGYQGTGAKQERAKWDQWYEQRCQPVLHLHLPSALLCTHF